MQDKLKETEEDKLGKVDEFNYHGDMCTIVKPEGPNWGQFNSRIPIYLFGKN